jgi:hypothetical protein
MKTILQVILSLLFLALVSCQKNLNTEESISAPQSISTFQKQMLEEFNFARTNPSGYAELRLKTAFIEGSDNGCYTYMKNLSPGSVLVFNNALNISATKYAQFLADKNLMGHNQDGTPLKRAITVGFTGSSIGENIAASTGEACNGFLDPSLAAINFVRILLIDTGVADLGHRMTMLNSIYSTVGIGYSHNAASTYVNYTVQDFGGGF